MARTELHFEALRRPPEADMIDAIMGRGHQLVYSLIYFGDL